MDRTADTSSHGMDPHSPEFRSLFTQVLRGLQGFIGTANDVVILAASGTGAMEAAVSNLTSPGDRVLVLSAGKYAERWTALAKNFACAVDVVSRPYGETFDAAEIKAALKLETRAVFMQTREMGTGTVHDVEGVAKLLRDTDSEALLVVDAIDSLGTVPLDMDAWGVDVVVAASQTAGLASPGLSYLAVSAKAWDRMEATYNPRYYFDLRKYNKHARTGESPYTPPVSLIAELGASLQARAEQ